MGTVFFGVTGRYSGGRISRLVSGAPHAAILAMLCIALGIVLLRASCAIAFTPHSHGGILNFIVPAAHAGAGHLDWGGAPPASCCDRVEGATLVKPADMLANWTRGAPFAIVFFASAGMLPFVRRRVPQVIFPLTAFPGRSYYARSARIQR